MKRESSSPEPEPDTHPRDEGQQDELPIGGEIRVTGGGMPRFLRWAIYLLYVWGAVYLVVHPTVPHREILFIFAALIGAWLLFFALTKRPPEL